MNRKLILRWLVFSLLVGGLSAYASDEIYFPDLAFVKNAKPFRFIRPAYPADATQKGTSGAVRVAIAISNDGFITDRRIISSEPAGTFDKAVLDALGKWHYQPYLVDGKPTAFQTVISFTFKVDVDDSFPSQPPKFVWRTEDMQAEIKSGRLSPAMKQNQYLHLTQRLNENEAGWTIMNMVVPDQWNIKELSVANGFVRLLNTDGETYHLTGENVEKLQELIRKYYPVTNEQLLNIWRELALVID